MIQKTLIFLLSVAIIGSAYKVSDFKPGFFKSSPPEGFHEVDTGSDRIGQILSFADINGDHYTDYVAVEDRKKPTLNLYFWHDQTSNFIKQSLQLIKDSFKSIEELMICDLNNDGLNDITVVYLNNNDKYDMEIYTTSKCQGVGNCKYSLNEINYEIFTNMTSYPVITNNEGDSVPQFLTFEGNKRYLSIRQDNRYKKVSFSQFINFSNEMQFKQVSKHFTTIIDFTGDCQSDLFMVSMNGNSQELQFYSKQSSSKYILQKHIPFPNKIVFVTFADLDGSGGVDIIMIVEINAIRKILIGYNTNQIEGLCVQKTNNKVPFKFDNLLSVELEDGITPTESLNLGDVDSDGFPDILGIFKSGGYRKAFLLLNREGKDNRIFIETPASHLITNEINPEQVAFFDLAEDGKLDILVMAKEKFQNQNVTTDKITRKSIINNLKEDTLFIKILPLSPSSSYDAGSTHISASFGVTIQWLITMLDGSKKIQTLNQKTQWSYGALQLPFALGGLGRTNNYLEDLTVGYQGTGNKESWSPIIPNSQLMVYRQSNQWKLQTLLTNIDRVYSVVYVSIVILILLGLVVLFLNHRQSKEDRRDHYNFIQMIR